MNRLYCVLCLCVFAVFSACAPLPPEPTDTSTPEELSSALVQSLISNDSEIFAMDILLSEENMTALAKQVEEEGKFSINPMYINDFAKVREQVIGQWQTARIEGQKDGVLWKTASYYGCRYKMKQGGAFLPVSKTFEIFIQSGGYFYQFDMTSILVNDDYYVFGDLKWQGEVTKPESVAKGD